MIALAQVLILHRALEVIKYVVIAGAGLTALWGLLLWFLATAPRKSHGRRL